MSTSHDDPQVNSPAASPIRGAPAATRNDWASPSSDPAATRYSDDPHATRYSDWAAGAAAPPSVPGYELLGELARGGMGVVYKARQLGFNRIIALKMILSGSHAGTDDRERFRAEAEAIARLQHPNIVQVHELGEHENKPYFSMEFCSGGGLHRRLNGTPLPPKEAAGLAETLSRAVQAAHDKCVVHRDLKPANVLLAEDGTPKVTDFGLAKRMDDAGRTQSGDFLGTPSYAAPEQAAGKSREVGPAVDIYALGAILYECLTGRPPFKGPTALDTLAQVLSDEPVPPRRLQPKTPHDLETICLKCLQKDPKKRYDSAGALAEDLRRFLNNEPILARPVGRLEYAWRWCRRNPRLALMGAATALIVVAWAVSMSVLAAMLKSEKDQSDHNYAFALDEKKQADASAADARDKKDLADRNALMAKANKKKASDGAATAVRRMTEMAGRVQQQLNGRFFGPEAAPELRALRDGVLKQVRDSMTAMAQDLEKAEATEFSEAGTYQLMGDRLKHLGRGTEALKQYRLGRDVVEKTAHEQPDSDKAQANLAVMLLKLADMELELNRDAAAARDDDAKALQLRQNVADHPHSGDYTASDDTIGLSHLELHLGQTYLALGDAATARDHLDRAVSLSKAWSDETPNLDVGRSYLVETYLWRGTADALLGDAKAARESFNEARRLQQELVDKYPDAYWYKADLAEVFGRLGDLDLQQGATAEAKRNYIKSLEYLYPSLESKPEETDFQLQMAAAEERLAAVAERKGDTEAARDAYQKALRIRQELLAIEPSNLTWQAAEMRTLAHCGKGAEAAQKADELTKHDPKNVALQMAAARCYAVCAATTGDAAAKRRYTDQAVGALRAAADAGYKDVSSWKSDPDLAPLVREPSFQSLLEELAKR